MFVGVDVVGDLERIIPDQADIIDFIAQGGIIGKAEACNLDIKNAGCRGCVFECGEKVSVGCVVFKIKLRAAVIIKSEGGVLDARSDTAGASDGKDICGPCFKLDANPIGAAALDCALECVIKVQCISCAGTAGSIRPFKNAAGF